MTGFSYTSIHSAYCNNSLLLLNNSLGLSLLLSPVEMTDPLRKTLYILCEGTTLSAVYSMHAKVSVLYCKYGKITRRRIQSVSVTVRVFAKVLRAFAMVLKRSLERDSCRECICMCRCESHGKGTDFGDGYVLCVRSTTCIGNFVLVTSAAVVLPVAVWLIFVLVIVVVVWERAGECVSG